MWTGGARRRNDFVQHIETDCNVDEHEDESDVTEQISRTTL